jgi:hypothetical protein
MGLGPETYPEMLGLSFPPSGVVVRIVKGAGYRLDLVLVHRATSCHDTMLGYFDLACPMWVIRM